MYTDEERSKLARKVLKDDVFYNYPTWFDKIEVGPGEMSEMSGMQAWMMLSSDQKKRPLYLISPVKVDVLLDRQEIIVEKIETIFKNEDIVVAELENVADVLTFNLVNEDYDMLSESAGDTKEVVFQVIKDINVERNFNMQDMSIRNDIMEYGWDYPEVVGKLRDIRVKVPNYKEIKTMEDYNSVRSKDINFNKARSGFKQMTDNCLFGRVTSKLMYTITEFLDIRQCLQDYRLKVLVVQGVRLKRYLIDMLVRNGFFVVDNRYNKFGELTKRDIAEGRVGVFGSKESNIEYALYVNDTFYKDVNSIPNVPRLLDIKGQLDSYRALCVFTRVYLFDGIDHISYGLLPSACPENGQVICVFPPMCSYDKLILARRSRDYMIHRYENMNSRELWVERDILSGKCGYKEKFILPRVSQTLGQRYNLYWGLQDYSLGLYKRVIDERVMLASLIENFRRSDEAGKHTIIMAIIKIWDGPYTFPWIRVWSDNNYDSDYLLDMLENYDDDIRRVIWACRNYELSREKISGDKVISKQR